jgi:hypothetical protein
MRDGPNGFTNVEQPALMGHEHPILNYKEPCMLQGFFVF